MSFFRSVNLNLGNRNRDTFLKESLLKKLNECVKEIQYNQYEESFQSLLGDNDTTIELCSSLEAIFLHGLKDNFLRKAKNALSGDPDYKPQPNFWPLVLVLSHRDIIDEISCLQNIQTEIGQCRAWLRIALNECLLSSYIASVLRNISAVKPFYNRSAYICDAEILEVSKKLIEGMETCLQFKFPINSSLLNTWPEQVLLSAGIWTTSGRLAPITAAVDVLTVLPADGPVTPQTPHTPYSINPFLINEDEAVKMILGKFETSRRPSSFEEITEIAKENDPVIIENNLLESPSSSKVDDLEIVENVIETQIEEIEAPKIGNNIGGKTCWSTENPEDLTCSITSESSYGSGLIKTPESKSNSSLVDPSTVFENTNINKPNLKDNIKKIYEDLKAVRDVNRVTTQVTSENIALDDPFLNGLEFEVITAVSKSFSVEELQKFLHYLTALSREQGLDTQDYKCKGCRDPLGSAISKAKVCAYTGEYFCYKCIDPNIFMIPARVIHNFDFKRYPVSKRAAKFLLDFQNSPWIDMKKVNPKVYQNVSEMAQLHELRIQLNFLRAYIFTCREPIIEELKKRVWPREYLYDQIHHYTIADLAHIPTGSLALQLEKVVGFARSHVLECWLCSQKGFICEVCKNTKILYPFDTSSTYRCEECASVFHAKCLNESSPCPKCKRKQNRKEISLVDAVHNQFTIKH